MATHLLIHVMTGQDDQFYEMLDDAGVEFTRRLPQPGVVMNAGITIELLQNLATNAAWPAALGAVIIAWIKSRSSRKATFTTKDHEVVHAFEGMSPEEIERLVKLSKSIGVIDIAPKKKSK